MYRKSLTGIVAIMHFREQKSRENLALLSLSEDFDQALAEWDFDGDVDYSDVSLGTCGLCGQKNLIYNFHIVNRNNGNKLTVGSACIKKFYAIHVHDTDGVLLTEQSSRNRLIDRHLKFLIEQKKRDGSGRSDVPSKLDIPDRFNGLCGPESRQLRRPSNPDEMIRPFRPLWGFEESLRSLIESSVERIKAGLGVDVSLMAEFFLLLGKHGIDYEASWYRVDVRPFQLTEMSNEKRLLVWPCLDPQQRFQYSYLYRNLFNDI